TLKKIILMTLFALLAACTPTTEPPTDTDDDTTAPPTNPTGGTDVYVNGVEVSIMESFPVQVAITVRGDLADGCVVLDDISFERIGDTFMLRTHAHREGDICTSALVPFEEVVDLDVVGLAAGTYQVDLDEHSTEFTLDMDNGETTETLTEGILITLERTACFGTCPIYTVSIDENGRILYNGLDFVTATGEQTAQIDPQQVQDLVDFMVNGRYFELEDAYTNRLVTDLPSAITSLTIDGKTKRIDRYFGDDTAPLILQQIENRIDQVANTSQWTGQSPDANSTGAIFGQLLVRGATGEVKLPAGAVITVRLEDVSLQDAPSVVISEKTYGDTTPLPGFYDIAYDLNQLDANAMYAVSADVTSADGQLLYWTDTMHNVLTFGAGTMVDIELVSTG
ncbi:MAG: DUF6438 domain-containing protein, partial [Chloroflexota bacterium]